jgi:ABC-2 type transport system permease protein
MNTRATLAWSLRRELWEHRSVYIAPLVAAGIALLAFIVHVSKQAGLMQGLLQLDPAKRAAVVAMPYSIMASVILFTSFVVALFYCLDALYAERRDRSILFWKSMPVSDRMTVLTKALVPMAVIPAIAFVIAFGTQLLLVAASSGVLAASGVDVGAVWSALPLGQMTGAMAYGLVVHALWYAPIYGWLLLVSAWAKKAPFLWAVFPVLALVVFEKIAFGTSNVFSLMRYRFMGAMAEAFTPGASDSFVTAIEHLDPARFVASPGLWIGLIAAAAFTVVAIRMRRSREPI